MTTKFEEQKALLFSHMSIKSHTHTHGKRLYLHSRQTSFRSNKVEDLSIPLVALGEPAALMLLQMVKVSKSIKLFPTFMLVQMVKVSKSIKSFLNITNLTFFGFNINTYGH